MNCFYTFSFCDCRKSGTFSEGNERSKEKQHVQNVRCSMMCSKSRIIRDATKWRIMSFLWWKLYTWTDSVELEIRTSCNSRCLISADFSESYNKVYCFCWCKIVGAYVSILRQILTEVGRRVWYSDSWSTIVAIDELYAKLQRSCFNHTEIPFHSKRLFQSSEKGINIILCGKFNRLVWTSRSTMV